MSEMGDPCVQDQDKINKSHTNEVNSKTQEWIEFLENVVIRIFPTALNKWSNQWYSLRAQPAPEAQWIKKRLFSASNCFRCINKIKHIHQKQVIDILCMNPCEFQSKSMKQYSHAHAQFTSIVT
jgi:hypothetical protein